MEHREFNFCQDIGLILLGFVIFDSAYSPWTGAIPEFHFEEGEFTGERAGIIILFCFSIVNTLFFQRLWEPFFWSFWRLISHRKNQKMRRFILALRIGHKTFFRGLKYLFAYAVGLILCGTISYLLIGNKQFFLTFLGLSFIFGQLAFDHDLAFFRRTGRFPVWATPSGKGSSSQTYGHHRRRR